MYNGWNVEELTLVIDNKGMQSLSIVTGLIVEVFLELYNNRRSHSPPLAASGETYLKMK